MNLRIAIVLGALLGAAGVGLGAYHAHGLEKRLANQGIEATEIAKRIDQGEVGVRYLMVHTLAFLFLGLVADRQPSRWLTVAGLFLLLGVLCFSGGLFMLSMGGPETLRHWAIVPLGGLSLIVAWCALFGYGCCVRRS